MKNIPGVISASQVHFKEIKQSDDFFVFVMSRSDLLIFHRTEWSTQGCGKRCAEGT